VTVATGRSLSRAEDDAAYRRRDEPGIGKDNRYAMNHGWGLLVELGQRVTGRGGWRRLPLRQDGRHRDLPGPQAPGVVHHNVADCVQRFCGRCAAPEYRQYVLMSDDAVALVFLKDSEVRWPEAEGR